MAILCPKMNTHPSSKSFEKAIVSNIQRFSLHDGPGIRTTVFLKGCPLRCIWCQNPECLSASPEIAFRRSRCIGCQACKETCRHGAIVPGAERRVDHARCNACGECAKACPTGALDCIGKEWSAEDLAEEVARDDDFFRESGGGITFSGGEPLMHAAFIETTSTRLRERGINIAVETCGFFAPSLAGMLVRIAECIYFDLKHMDPARHRDLTGQDNSRILENFSALAAIHGGLQPRMPVMPGLNDGVENIRRTASFILGKGIRTIHCLPYNPLGRDKLEWINTSQKPPVIEVPGPEKMEELKTVFKREGVDAIVYS